jgi:outer membrane protein assembly factor BamB
LGAPVVAGAIAGPDGTVYESANNGILHALDPANGRDRWTFHGGGSTNNNEDLSTSAALLSDGTILWPAPSGRLDALSPAGKLRWSLPLNGSVLSPAVVGDHVYVSDTHGDLASISATSTEAKIRWSLKLGKVSFGSPAVGQDGTVYTTVDNRLEAIKDFGSKAKVRWIFEPHSDIEVSPSVAPDGTVILGTNDGFEYGITPQGTVRWRYPLGEGIFSYSTPAVTADDLAYFGDNRGVVHVVRAETGAVIGRYTTHSQALSSNGVGVWTAPAVDGRHDVYFGTASGHIFGYTYNGSQLFDFATGAIVASYPALVDDGLLVIGSDNGNLYAFGNGN